jgi:hypothetical protein
MTGSITNVGFSYGVGNLGKIIGPLGLALIAGSSAVEPDTAPSGNRVLG